MGRALLVVLINNRFMHLVTFLCVGFPTSASTFWLWLPDYIDNQLPCTLCKAKPLLFFLCLSKTVVIFLRSGMLEGIYHFSGALRGISSVCLRSCRFPWFWTSSELLEDGWWAQRGRAGGIGVARAAPGCDGASQPHRCGKSLWRDYCLPDGRV